MKKETSQKAQRLKQLQQGLHFADPLATGNLQTDLTQLQARREECSDLPITQGWLNTYALGACGLSS